MKLSKLCTVISIFCILVSSVAADSQEPPPPPGHLTVLKDLFDVTNPDPSGIIKTADNETTSVWFEKAFQLDKNNLHVFFTKTHFEDTCEACGGAAIGSITYKQVEGQSQWQIVSKQTKIANIGSGGRAPDIERVDKFEFSPNIVAFFIYQNYERQDESFEWAELFIFANNNWRDLGSFRTGENSFAKCDDSNKSPNCIGTKGKLSIVSKKDSEYPDLVIRHSKIDYKEVPLHNFPDKTINYYYNREKYIEQCNYFDQFVKNEDGTVTDLRDGTIWQICPVGQTWTGQACKGKVSEVAWWDAMQAAKKSRFLDQADWRLPTFTELNAITGTSGLCNSQPEPGRAVSLALATPINKEKSLGTFWSSSTYVDYIDYAFAADFTAGNLSYGDRKYTNAVRLVRAGNPDSTKEFEREFAKIAEYKASSLAQKHKEEQQAKQDAIDAKRQAKQAAIEAKRKNEQEAKESKSNVDQIKQEVIQRCRVQMGAHGAAMVKACVDQDIEALPSIVQYLKKYPSIAGRCLSSMKQHGYAMVKACAEQDIEAEDALSRY